MFTPTPLTKGVGIYMIEEEGSVEEVFSQVKALLHSKPKL